MSFIAEKVEAFSPSPNIYVRQLLKGGDSPQTSEKPPRLCIFQWSIPRSVSWKNLSLILLILGIYVLLHLF